ncbi:flagellar biosynthesis protein FlhA [Candidatus Margulisiibacteriota bacterium]
MILPMPTWLLDILLVFNIAAGITILLISMFIKKALDILAYPSIVLVFTLYRLALNVASTRLILALGPRFDGRVIITFADYVTRGSFVVGGIIFTIITIVNILVITKGAERVAEVAARFSLDAMPGKQMSIDADLNAGLIDGDEAKMRRENLSKESNFFGAMDGANKFVRGDAFAGIIIVFVNILGGMAIGRLQLGLEMNEVVRVYTRLTIGDGLVQQIPALLISIATGLVVTKSASEMSLGADVADQIGKQPRAFAFCSIILLMFGLIPGFPSIPFFVLAIATGMASYFLLRKESRVALERAEGGVAAEGAEAAKEALKKPENLLGTLSLDPISLKTGRNLVPLIDPSQDGPLLERITLVRYHIGQDLGFVIPGVRVMDDLSLPPNDYIVEIRGSKIADGQAILNHQFVPLALDELSAKGVSGEEVEDPITGLPGVWVPDKQIKALKDENMVIRTPVEFIATHFTEVIKNHADEIMTRQNAQSLLELVKNTNAAIVRELVPDMLSLGQVHKVLQGLVKERVSIRDLSTILERLADYAHVTRDTALLSEHVRQSLARQICTQYMDKEDTVTVLTIDPRLEEMMINAVHQSEYGSFLALDPNVGEKIINQLNVQKKNFIKMNRVPIILCSPRLRPHFKKFTERSLPGLVVLSYNEVIPQVKVQSIGIVSAEG